MGMDIQIKAQKELYNRRIAVRGIEIVCCCCPMTSSNVQQQVVDRLEAAWAASGAAPEKRKVHQMARIEAETRLHQLYSELLSAVSAINALKGVYWIFFTSHEVFTV